MTKNQDGILMMDEDTKPAFDAIYPIIRSVHIEKFNFPCAHISGVSHFQPISTFQFVTEESNDTK